MSEDKAKRKANWVFHRIGRVALAAASLTPRLDPAKAFIAARSRLEPREGLFQKSPNRLRSRWTWLALRRNPSIKLRGQFRAASGS